MDQPSLSQRPGGIASSVLKLALDYAERGMWPDWLIRQAVRRLLRSRIAELERISVDARQDLLRALQSQPIAIVPEKANEQHYEVPDDFFQLVLGPRMKYSCGYWIDDSSKFEDSEDEALRRTCENAKIVDGMDVLELGCGWGSLTIWMAENFPNCSITAVSNSHSQRRFIQHRCDQMNLQNVSIVTADMNEFLPKRTFDRVVSVEMFEHMRNLHKLTNQIAEWLNPAGKLLVHVFCHRNRPYLFRTDGPMDWMGRNFFTGGLMPDEHMVGECASDFDRQDHWRWSGTHYARTSRAWLGRLDDNQEKVLTLFGQGQDRSMAIRTMNRWRMFFIACEELFNFNDGSEWFVVQTLLRRQ